MKNRNRRRTIAAVLDEFGKIEIIKQPVVQVVETCEGDCTVQEQTPLQEITGKWPGDETIEELLDTLKDGE